MDNYAIVIYWSDEDQVYIAEVPELPGCITHGETRSAALTNAIEAIQLWIDTAREFDNPIPEPKRQHPAAQTPDQVKYGLAGGAGRSSLRRNRSRIFSGLRAPQPTTNPKAH